MYKKFSLTELVHNAQFGDNVALEALLTREEKFIYNTLINLKAETIDIPDIVQEILVKISKNLPNLRSPELFRAWEKRIIVNQFYDNLRKKDVIKKNIQNTDNNEVLKLIPDYTTNPYQAVAMSELNSVIKKSIQNLPDNFKKAIIMREIAGLSYERISKITNMKIGTVKSRISRAREKLQEILEPYLIEK